MAEQQTRAKQPERHDWREKRPKEGDIWIEDDGQTKRDGEGDGQNDRITTGATRVVGAAHNGQRMAGWSNVRKKLQ